MSATALRVCVIGPECTGKTTLAHRLAAWLHTGWVPEASRRYAERVNRELLASDVAPIAREHIELADAAAALAHARGASALVLDTDLISTIVYARHYYEIVPAWIARAERDRRADLYLLCDVDVEWVPDGVRDRPAKRDAMFGLFRHALEARSVRYVVIHGVWDARWTLALNAVASLGLSPTTDATSHGARK